MVRGQAATEYLLLVSVGLAMLVFFISLVNEEMVRLNLSSDESLARASLDQLCLSAKALYLRGEGSSTTVGYSLPSSYDPNNSFIENSTVLMRIGKGDMVCDSGVQLKGTLPKEHGTGKVLLYNKDTYVLVNSEVVFVIPAQLAYSLMLNHTGYATFTVYNNAGSPANVAVSLPDLSPNVDLACSPCAAPVPAGGSLMVNVSASSPELLPGSFSGLATVESSYTNGSDTSKVSISVDLYPLPQPATNYSSPTGLFSPARTFNTYETGVNYSSQYLICVPGAASAWDVYFGAYGNTSSWYGNIAPVFSVPPQTCFNKTVTFLAPDGATAGNYTSSLMMLLSNSAGVNDTAASIANVNLLAVNRLYLGPVNASPLLAFSNSNVTFKVPLLAYPQGNNITGCKSSFGGSNSTMYPEDGSFNSGNETAVVNYSNVPPGQHNFSFSCTSRAVNNTTAYNMSFYSSILLLGPMSASPPKPFSYDNVTLKLPIRVSPQNNIAGCISLRDNLSDIYFMRAENGSYNASNETVVLNYSVNYVNVSPGQHNFSFSCASLAVNNTTTSSMPFYGSMLLITNSSIPSSTEASWIDFINSTQGSITNWTLDTANATWVNNSKFNTSFYRMLVFVNYSPSWNLSSVVKQFNASNRSVLLLSAALLYAPWDFKLSAYNGTSVSNSRIYIANNSRYITLPYYLGRLSVLQSSATYYYNNFSMTSNASKLADAMSGNSNSTRLINQSVLWVNGSFFGWGINADSSLFTDNGTNITIRVIDYALNSSKYP